MPSAIQKAPVPADTGAIVTRPGDGASQSSPNIVNSFRNAAGSQTSTWFSRVAKTSRWPSADQRIVTMGAGSGDCSSASSRPVAASIKATARGDFATATSAPSGEKAAADGSMRGCSTSHTWLQSDTRNIRQRARSAATSQRPSGLNCTLASRCESSRTFSPVRASNTTTPGPLAPQTSQRPSALKLTVPLPRTLLD